MSASVMSSFCSSIPFFSFSARISTHRLWNTSLPRLVLNELRIGVACLTILVFLPSICSSICSIKSSACLLSKNYKSVFWTNTEIELIENSARDKFLLSTPPSNTKHVTCLGHASAADVIARLATFEMKLFSDAVLFNTIGRISFTNSAIIYYFTPGLAKISYTSVRALRLLFDLRLST